MNVLFYRKPTLPQHRP